jgi:membrane protein
MKRLRTVLEALYRLYEHSGFTIAGAVAFSFVVSLFPFCIFLGALAGIFGGRELAQQAVAQLFDILPRPVAEGLSPEVYAIMGSSRIDLLTASGFLALFFATSAIETLRAALNGAYRVRETRPYALCLLISMLFVFASAVSTLFLTWAVVVGPVLAERFQPDWAKQFLESTWIGTSLKFFEETWLGPFTRYGLAFVVIAAQLFALHLWLTAGHRRFQDVWPGILLSIALWLGIASLWSSYLALTNYSLFYAGLSQLMIALIFFQFTAIAILLGAELNRGIMEVKKMRRDAAAKRAILKNSPG